MLLPGPCSKAATLLCVHDKEVREPACSLQLRIMANSGKVLHLYVEVRSMDDEHGKELKNMDGLPPLKVHGQDVFSQSHHRAQNTPVSFVPPDGDMHKVGSSAQGLFTSKSPTRYPVSLQIHSGEEGQTPLQHEQTLPHDEIYQLLSALQPELIGGTGNLLRTCSTEPFSGRKSKICGHFTAPPTPSGARKTYGQAGEGKRSIVTYSYIEKANIRSVGGHHSTLLQNEPENPFKKALNDQTIPFHCDNSFCNSNLKNTVTDSVIKPKNTSSLQCTMLNSIARNATHCALEGFGSPQFRRQLATANCPDRSYGTLHKDQARCHSWSGSPVVPRIARTLPANAHLVDPYQHMPLCGIPRSQAAHNLPNNARQPYTISCSTNVQSQAIPQQQEWRSDETLRQGYSHSPILPGHRPTAIQHEFSNKTISQAPHNQTVGQKTSQSPQQNNKVNFSLTTSNQQTSRGNKLNSEKSIFTLSSAEMTPNLVEEATKMFIHLEDRKPSSPTPSLSDTVKSDCTRSGQQPTGEISTKTSTESNLFAHDQHWDEDPVHTRYSSDWTSPHLSHRSCRSPVLCPSMHQMSTPAIQEPQQENKEITGKNSLVLYQHQTPQNTGDSNILRQEYKHYDAGYGCGLRDHSDIIRVCTPFNTNIPVKSRESYSSRVKGNTDKENACKVEDSLDMTLVMLSKENRNDSTVLNPEETLFMVPTQKDIRMESLTYGEQNSALSQSSSGVTGSLVEVIQPERDSISPVTSSQTSHKSSGTRNTDIQVRYQRFILIILVSVFYHAIFFCVNTGLKKNILTNH